jgi:DNA-binding GntR family transcriptional regulator
VPEIHTAVPAYLQIARHLRDQITSGELTDGALVPSARQLAGDWKVSAPTAVKALNVLSSEGLVVTRTGYGTIVQAPSLHRSARDHTVSVIKTGRIYPEGHYAKVAAAALVPAPEAPAAALGIDEGAPVIRRQRITLNASDTPLSTSVSWFDGSLVDVAPLLLQTDRIIQGTTRYVEEATGRTRSLSERMYISAGAATAEEAEALGIDEGSPVLRTRNYYWDTGGAVIEYGEAAAAEGQETAIDYTIEETTT